MPLRKIQVVFSCSTNLLQFTSVDIIKLWILFQFLSIMNPIISMFHSWFIERWIDLYYER